MQTVTEEKTEVTAAPTIQERIAALPGKDDQRLRELQALLAEKQAEAEEKQGEVQVVLDELVRLSRGAIEKNMTPDEKVLAGIADRWTLSSSKYGVDKKDFDAAVAEIGTNERVLAQLRRLQAMKHEMTIASVSDEWIDFQDTVEEEDAAAQVAFAKSLDQKERSDAIASLQEQIPNIEQYLERSESDKGQNYYDDLLLRKVTGTRQTSKDEYRELQDKKPVDRRGISWLSTEKEMLDHGDALFGARDVRGVFVGGNYAVSRGSVRAGRPRLRVKRS